MELRDLSDPPRRNLCFLTCGGDLEISVPACQICGKDVADEAWLSYLGRRDAIHVEGELRYFCGCDDQDELLIMTFDLPDGSPAN